MLTVSDQELEVWKAWEGGYAYPQDALHNKLQLRCIIQCTCSEQDLTSLCILGVLSLTRSAVSGLLFHFAENGT